VGSITEAAVGVVSAFHAYFATAADSLSPIMESASRAGLLFARSASDVVSGISEIVGRVTHLVRSVADAIAFILEQAFWKYSVKVSDSVEYPVSVRAVAEYSVSLSATAVLVGITKEAFGVVPADHTAWPVLPTDRASILTSVSDRQAP
jgi:hypothetical protein